MNWRWYLTGLTIALALLGISVDNSTIPNQEIVVRFDASAISSNEANRAISKITSRLESIGVDEVQVSKLHDGKLKVAYYSTIDVAVIKSLFKHQDKLQFDDSGFTNKHDAPAFPFNPDSNSYVLDIVVIQKQFTADLGLQGLPVSTKHLKDQYLGPNLSLSISEFEVSLKSGFEKVAFKNYRNLSLLLNKTSHKIPEVRAGPLS